MAALALCATIAAAGLTAAATPAYAHAAGQVSAPVVPTVTSISPANGPAAGRTPHTATATTNLTTVAPTPHVIAASGSGLAISTASTGPLPSVSDPGPYLLVAFVSSDGPGASQSATVSGGGLTWTLAERANIVGGTAEIWTAYTTTSPENDIITSTPLWPGYFQVLLVDVFAGASGIGAVAAAGQHSGQIGVTLTTTAANSWVYAVGEDYSQDTTITPGDGQHVISQTKDTVNHDTFWIQSQNQATPTAGTQVTTYDSAPPLYDTWNIAAVEIIPGPPTVVTTKITCGQTITTSIVVANDLTCAGNALTITASNVTVDLAGHTITGNTTGTGVTIISSGPLLDTDTVENGTIAGFAIGIAPIDVKNTTLDRLTLNGDSKAVFSRDIIVGLSITNSTILNCATVLREGSNISALSVSNTQVTGGAIYLSQLTGPIVFNSDGFTNTSIEFDIQGYVTMTGSTLSNSPLVDQGLFGKDLFQNNTFSGAATAFELYNELDETITGNTFTGNNIGLYLHADVRGLSGNSVTGNTFIGNKTAGLLVNDPTSAAGVTMSIDGNVAQNNGTAPDGRTDSAGNPVQGGLHVYIPNGQVDISDSQTAGNLGYGIFASAGTLTGSNNTSSLDLFPCNPLTLCTN